jgi:hypothetical protein
MTSRDQRLGHDDRPQSEIINRQDAKNAKPESLNVGKGTKLPNAPRWRFPVLRWKDQNIVFLATLASWRFKVFLRSGQSDTD